MESKPPLSSTTAGFFMLFPSLSVWGYSNRNYRQQSEHLGRSFQGERGRAWRNQRIAVNCTERKSQRPS